MYVQGLGPSLATDAGRGRQRLSRTAGAHAEVPGQRQQPHPRYAPAHPGLQLEGGGRPDLPGPHARVAQASEGV
eukprot:12805650-Alexandrium_andersonii.AAC.1